MSRANQKRRTRKDLLKAAARLMQSGVQPSLEDIAAEAMVSRATAYRYFPNAESLLVEAALDLQVPDTAAMLAGTENDSAEARAKIVHDFFHDQFVENEAGFRAMVAHTVRQRVAQKGGGQDMPVRQNRRTPAHELALEPIADKLGPEKYRLLAEALSVLTGPEAMIVFADVLQQPEARGKQVKHWMIEALLAHALRD